MNTQYKEMFVISEPGSTWLSVVSVVEAFM